MSLVDREACIYPLRATTGHFRRIERKSPFPITNQLLYQLSYAGVTIQDRACLPREAGQFFARNRVTGKRLLADSSNVMGPERFRVIEDFAAIGPEVTGGDRSSLLFD